MEGFNRPSSVACTECRSKHLKCDALQPSCSRCMTRGRVCEFVGSKRGMGGRAKKIQKQSARNDSVIVPQYGTSNNMGAFGPQQPASDMNASQVMSPPWTDPDDTSPSGSSPSALSPSSHSTLRSEDEHLTNLYYKSFHTAHPILVPRTRYATQSYPAYLRQVVKFIGGHYATNIPVEDMKVHIAVQLRDSDEKTPEMVQALLLFGIALHSRYEPMESMPTIVKAANLAIELGMHHSEFTSLHGRGDFIYIESLRRTWWELFITDGYLAALHRNNTFRTNDVTATACLPCDDKFYADRAYLPPPPPTTLTQLNDRVWANDDIQFSSYSYRIEAIRILARVIAVAGVNDTPPDVIQAIDNAIAGWKHFLPHDKASIIDHNGDGDQLMFQAFTFINLASIFLHFPRSELPVTMPRAADITCAQKHMELVSPTSTQHAGKTITASRDMTNLASLPMDKHSPFFICGLVFACIVQLSAYSAHRQQGKPDQNRDRVALILAVMKSFSHTWNVAAFTGTQLKRAANQTFNPGSEVSNPGTSISSMDSGIDMLQPFPADTTWFDLFFNEGLQPPGMMGNEMMPYPGPP